MKLPRPGGGAVAIGDGRPPAIILDAGLASRWLMFFAVRRSRVS